MTAALLQPPGQAWRGLQWPDATVAILASGPSMTAAVAGLVQAWRGATCAGSRRAIAINNTWERARWVDVLYACDGCWWKMHLPRLREAEFGGALWTQDAAAARDHGLHHIPSILSPGLSRKAGVIHQGGNGGYQAVGLAHQAGARRILLFGFDLRGGHWHGEHPRPLTNPPQYLFETWKRNFRPMAADLMKEGVEVINCTPGSALDAFPMADPAEVLR